MIYLVKLYPRNYHLKSFHLQRKNKIGVHYKTINFSTKGIIGTISALGQTLSIESNLLGNFNAKNILAAVGLSIALGIKKNAIEMGIKNVP